MKSLNKVMLMIVMVMISTLSFANGEKPSVEAKIVGAKVVALSANGFGTGETQIKLKDERGSVIHSEKIAGINEYAKKFDLTSLKAGTYYFEIENETSFGTVPVEVSAVATNVLDKGAMVILKPVIRRNGDLLDILIPSENGTPVDVAIYDSSFNRVFKETVDCQDQLKVRRYDLSKLAEGGYRIKMNTKGKEFTQFVAVK